MLHALAGTGARILVLERGDFVPQEDANWDPAAVWKELRYRATERMARPATASRSGRTRTTASAATRSSGAACCTGCGARTSAALQHADGVSPAWPIDYDTLEPYYDAAERLYHVHGQAGDDPTEAPARAVSLPADSARAADGGDRRRAARARPAPVVAAAGPDPARARRAAASCATRAIRFRAASHAKSDADVLCVRPALGQPNVTLWTGARADAAAGVAVRARASRRWRSSGRGSAVAWRPVS